MPKDGLYEFKGGRSQLISEEFYNGNNLGAQFREPLWGPNGNYALTTSMEMETYKKWIGPEQERNMKRDPMFKEFVLAMNALGEMPMYMTKEELDVREALVHKVMLQILDEDAGPSP